MTETLFIQDLKLNLEGDVLHDDVSLGIYATDASVYQIRPEVVVLPKHNEDVTQAIKIARDHNVSILPRGGGTSLAGQTVGASMVLDFSKYMNKIMEFNSSKRWVVVQPGIVRDELNRFLAEYGLHFAPDPATSSRANVGGMIGNNSSGTKSILYGKTVDHILETKVILPDSTMLDLQAVSPALYQQKQAQPDREGKLYRAFKQVMDHNPDAIKKAYPKVMRRVQGYNLDEFLNDGEWNLSKLICGSEGTLATILEAKLNLEPLPKCKAVCVVHFDNLQNAIRAVQPMLKFKPAAIEILDEHVVELSRTNLTTARHCHFIVGRPKAIQIVEFFGDHTEELQDRAHQMIEHLQSLDLGYAYPFFQQGPSYEDVWIIRKKGLGLMLGMKGNKKPLAFIEDAGIPTEHLPEYIGKVLDICKRHNTEAAMYAHASVGVIHVRPILDLRDPQDIRRFKSISEETFQLVKSYGGSWSGEHGDGLVRSHYLKSFFGEEVYQLLVQVKEIFDPEYRMNPGKIIEAPPIDHNLRYGSSYRDEWPSTFYRYRDDGSFGHAIHMCTGVGECRKINGGTMCPSYRATLNEEDSTRGRANALRLAMSGQFHDKGLDHPRIKRTLDLCLSCKACKSECPSNVDMAKLKGEVFNMYYERHGSSVRDRMIRDAPAMAARWSGRLAPLANTLIKSLAARWLIEKTIGFHRHRKLPKYAPTVFSSWFKKYYVSPSNPIGQVALFADTYLNYHEPAIGIAAVRLLDHLGFEVLLAEVGCCQRPGISHGFLREARPKATAVFKQLQAFSNQSIPIVVCEPSCSSALLDDIPDLMSDSNLSAVPKFIVPLDKFVAEQLSRSPVPLGAKSKKIFIHGHCHHKALVGLKHVQSIFQLIPDIQTDIIPSGCCGMAGSFGYEKEHYALSKKIANQVLIPAIGQIPSDAMIIADGFSCRHQIKQFSGREAVHWIEAIDVPGKTSHTP